MSVLFIFIDGIGIGERSDKNPFHLKSYESFNWMSDQDMFIDHDPVFKEKHLFKGIDANLGVKGLPQSGTGQTTLFTGVNASQEIGKHFGPFPHSGIKHLLKEVSIFHAAKEQNKKPYFVNAYPPIFFEHAKKRNRWSCTTLMTRSAELSLNSTEEVLKEEALTAEIVQNAWREKLGIDIPKITAKEAGRRLLNLVPDHDLLLYEYYLTDKAGHNQNAEDADRVLQPLDEFLLTILKEKRSEDTLVISSDHGNLEDLSTKTHTRNEVPLFVIGPEASAFSEAESIMDLKGIISDII
ncbi:hypothetical protein AB2B38_009810 [Balneola sp. MJW-20]|uniref:hypothetical protein n=1 Tax=Gracilimonas aurantiaca TaxID=3234185 RepID=UPI003466AD8D